MFIVGKRIKLISCLKRFFYNFEEKSVQLGNTLDFNPQSYKVPHPQRNVVLGLGGWGVNSLALDKPIYQI